MTGPDPARISRRRLLQLGALTPAAFLAACAETLIPAPSPITTLRPAASPVATPLPSPAPAAPVLFRGAALADGRSAQLQRDVSIRIENGLVTWIRPTGGEEDPAGAAVIDAGGATIVPGLVDAHAHITGAGGVHWIERFNDPPAVLAAIGEANAALAWQYGVRFLRDVGSPIRDDPFDGQHRAMALGVRDRLRGRPGFPVIRAAGSWITRSGSLPVGIGAEAANADELLNVAIQQLDAGADLVKLYLEGPDANASPWSTAETGRVVEAVHARGARVAAHAGHIAGIRAGVAAGVDTIEHGNELDAATAQQMAAQGTILVSTLTVLRSWLSFSATTTDSFFAGPGAASRFAEQLAVAENGVRNARAAGVAIAAGSDAGGGSARANHLPWEFQSLVAAGLEPVEALAAVTWRGGEALAEPDAGVIREGGPAHFFLVHGDPLTDSGAIWRIWRHA